MSCPLSWLLSQSSCIRNVILNMSNPIDREQDHASTQHDSPSDFAHTSVPVAPEPRQYASSESDLSMADPEMQATPEATKIVTQTTTTSSLTVESWTPQSEGARPWHKRLNPFKSRGTFPVPKQRTISKEYGAGFLSRLSFQWMAPLMKVAFCRSRRSHSGN